MRAALVRVRASPAPWLGTRGGAGVSEEVSRLRDARESDVDHLRDVVAGLAPQKDALSPVPTPYFGRGDPDAAGGARARANPDPSGSRCGRGAQGLEATGGVVVRDVPGIRGGARATSTDASGPVRGLVREGDAGCGGCPALQVPGGWDAGRSVFLLSPWFWRPAGQFGWEEQGQVPGGG